MRGHREGVWILAKSPNMLLSDRNPPRMGPPTRPALMPATMYPMFLAFSASLRLASIMAAWAIGWLPAVNPVIARPMIRNQRLSMLRATIVMTYPTRAPARQIMHEHDCRKGESCECRHYLSFSIFHAPWFDTSVGKQAAEQRAASTPTKRNEKVPGPIRFVW